MTDLPGNLVGKIDVFDRRTLNKVCSIDVPNAFYHFWSPDRCFLLTATLSPRLCVDNGIKIWHATGPLVHAQAVEEVYLSWSFFGRSVKFAWRAEKFYVRVTSAFHGDRRKGKMKRTFGLVPLRTMFLSRNSTSFCFIGLTTSMSCVSATYRRFLGDVDSDACVWEAYLVLWRVLRPSVLLDVAAFQGMSSTVQNGLAPTHLQTSGDSPLTNSLIHPKSATCLPTTQ